MTSGIYQLNFNEELFYVGQAQDIPARMKQHLDKFRKGTAAQKMQAAYNTHGVPQFSVLLYCHRDYLDLMETYFIHLNKRYQGCLNTSIPKLDPTVNYEALITHNLLEHSVVDMIAAAVKATGTATQLEEELSVLKTTYNERLMQLRAKEEVAQGRDENALYKKMYPSIEQAYKETQALLNKYQKRNLLQRIFNYD